jgi:bla regulator protein BlaR1
VIGGEAWLRANRYVIDAKTEGVRGDAREPTIKEENRQTRKMLQSLLTNRFKMIGHQEMKEMPVYALVVAKNGPRLRDSVTPSSSRTMLMERGRIAIEDLPVAALVEVLSQLMDRLVVDKTGLKGKYDFKLNWDPDQSELDPLTRERVSTQAGEEARSDNLSGLSIFSALQQQLGLKVEAAKGPVNTLVIDHVEAPSEN